MNTDQKPRHCLQCLRTGYKLTNGRCSTCCHRTPAALWREYHGAAPGDVLTSGTVLDADDAAAALDRINQLIAAAQIHRVEQIGPRCVLERHVDVDTGASVQRVTLVIIEKEATDD